MTKFPNDNLFVKLEESVREQDVFLVQSLHRPLSDLIMETADGHRRLQA